MTYLLHALLALYAALLVALIYNVVGFLLSRLRRTPEINPARLLHRRNTR